jgi:hypothetical protein
MNSVDKNITLHIRSVEVKTKCKMFRQNKTKNITLHIQTKQKIKNENKKTSPEQNKMQQNLTGKKLRKSKTQTTGKTSNPMPARWW